ncbi:hypothetical protein, partial [Pseudomonas syringae group sp. J309-1]|uniref:hypothetical protein n=1 Tax=Pseudomonas syringae group sp. J309-1 TaxID=3079588 RepID=UPI002908B3F7
GAAEGCDRGVSGEMLRSLRQLLQKMQFSPLICSCVMEAELGLGPQGAALVLGLRLSKKTSRAFAHD